MRIKKCFSKETLDIVRSRMFWSIGAEEGVKKSSSITHVCKFTPASNSENLIFPRHKQIWSLHINLVTTHKFSQEIEQMHANILLKFYFKMLIQFVIKFR